MFGMPTAEAAHSGKWHIAGCQPDMPIHRTWGCCVIAMPITGKDTPANMVALAGLVPWIWPDN